MNSGNGTSSRASIWAIDDEEGIIASMGGILEDSGFAFEGFLDPRVALERVELTGPPDLMLLDLNMPRMTGVEFLRELRKRPETSVVPVMVITALHSESAILNALEAGADDILHKPVSTPELLARINGHLSRSDRLAALRQENRDLKLLTDLAHVLSREIELPNILRTLIDALRGSVDIQIAAIYLLGESSKQLLRALPAEATRSEGAPKIALDLKNLPDVADGLAARKPALLGPDGTGRLLRAIGGEHPDFGPHRSSAIFPMMHRNELVGVIVLVGRRPNVGSAGRERFLTSIIANFAAVAVQRAGLIGTLREEHDQLDRANAELAKTRDFLQNVIMSSPDAIVASNRDAEIVLYNDAAERILGWDRDDAMGADVRRLYPPGTAERIMHMLRSDGFGGRGRIEPKRELVVDAEGNEIPVEISAAIVYSDDGEETATVGIFTDLRGRIRMEERLQEANESLERSRRQAVVAELAGAAAHELNQPLTSLLAYTELLTRRVDASDENRRAVETIDSESKRIADIVRKIGKITEYRTKEYVGGARIVDLDSASEVNDGLLSGQTEVIVDDVSDDN